MKMTCVCVCRVMVFRQNVEYCSTFSESIYIIMMIYDFDALCACTVSSAFSRSAFIYSLFTPFLKLLTFGGDKFFILFELILHGKKIKMSMSKTVINSSFFSICVSATCTVPKELRPFWVSAVYALLGVPGEVKCLCNVIWCRGVIIFGDHKQSQGWVMSYYFCPHMAECCSGHRTLVCRKKKNNVAYYY